MTQHQEWHEILELARRAPSPHNVQPWKLKLISDTEADLFIDNRRTLPKEDLSGSFILLAMGLFIETLKIIAANRQWSLSHVFHDRLENIVPQFEGVESRLIPFARLTLRRDDQAERFFDDVVVLQRRTSRVPYTPTLPSTKGIARLKNIAVSWKQEFAPIPEGEIIQQLVDWDTQALFNDMNHPAYHDEIVNLFRFTDRESERKRDGLDFRCMNFSRIEFWLSARMPWLMKTPGLRFILKSRYMKQFQPIRQMGYIAGPFWKADDGFKAGGFLAHFWLELTRQGFYMHPFGNLVTNPTASKNTHQHFGREDIWLIFRYGESSTPVQSRRLHVQEILLD